MPTFDTPAPITATAHIEAGSIHITAADRTDTVVDIRPRDPKKDQDVRAAAQTRVTRTDDTLTITTPRNRSLLGRTGTVDVTVELPTGSSLDITGAWTQILGEGHLGDVRAKTSAGDIRLDTTGPLDLTASHGSVTVDHVHGTARITTSSGSLRAARLDGPAVLKNSHGTTTVGTAAAELRVSGSNGDIDITRADGPVTATTAHGALRIAHATTGAHHLETSYGAIEIGIPDNTPAHLDISSTTGQVRNTLTPTTTPPTTHNTLKIHARTRYGNIDIRRART